MEFEYLSQYLLVIKNEHMEVHVEPQLSSCFIFFLVHVLLPPVQYSFCGFYANLLFLISKL